MRRKATQLISFHAWPGFFGATMPTKTGFGWGGVADTCCQPEQLHHNSPPCSVPDLASHEQQALPFPPLLTGVCPEKSSRVAVLDCPQGRLRMGTLRPSSQDRK
jgi:hypothetical protein